MGLININPGTTKKVQELENRLVILEDGTVISLTGDGKVFTIEVVDGKLVVTYDDGE